MSAHTPGPWFAGAQNDQLYIVDRRPNSTGNDYPTHESDTELIAKVYDSVRGAPAGDSNARLIAAAPDLLAALKAMVKVDAEDGTDDEYLRDARAAIDKAEGQS